MNFQTYLNNTFANYKETESLVHFKKSMLQKMEKRANEIKDAGLTDEKVLHDLVVNLYSDLEIRFQKYNPVVYTNGSLWDMAGRRGIFGV